MLDFLSIVLSIVVLIPILYLGSSNLNNYLSVAFLILISVPTVMALIHGAPFVPTPMKRVKKMLEIAKVKKGDRVYDIGCGDGRMVYLAANMYEAEATGFELSPIVYVLARVRKFFWKSKAQIKFANFKTQNISEADIIFCYLLPECFSDIEEKMLKELKQGAKVVSYAFQIPYLKLIAKEERDPGNNFAPIWIYEKE